MGLTFKKTLKKEKNTEKKNLTDKWKLLYSDHTAKKEKKNMFAMGVGGKSVTFSNITFHTINHDHKYILLYSYRIVSKYLKL